MKAFAVESDGPNGLRSAEVPERGQAKGKIVVTTD